MNVLVLSSWRKLLSHVQNCRKSKAFSLKMMIVFGIATLSIGENALMLAIAPLKKLRLAVITDSLQEDGWESHKRR